KPAVAQRASGRLPVVPIALHHAVAAGGNLADCAGRQLAAALIYYPHTDTSTRHARAAQACFVMEVAHVRVRGLFETGNGHRALALTVDLVELRTEQGERASQIGQVHGRAAID